ncbi:hypothetical protein PRIEUP_LOCUS1537 [Pristimantis euphronides]
MCIVTGAAAQLFIDCHSGRRAGTALWCLSPHDGRQLQPCCICMRQRVRIYITCTRKTSRVPRGFPCAREKTLCARPKTVHVVSSLSWTARTAENHTRGSPVPHRSVGCFAPIKSMFYSSLKTIHCGEKRQGQNCEYYSPSTSTRETHGRWDQTTQKEINHHFFFPLDSTNQETKIKNVETACNLPNMCSR